jgi:hypothetical protein
MAPKRLIHLHFSLVILKILTWVLVLLSDLRLNFLLEASLEFLILLSGCLICFFRPPLLKSFNLYYYFYPLWLVLISLASLFKSSFSAFILFFFLYPIWPDRLEAERDGYRIYDDAHGFMTRCCPYLISQNHYFLFEKELARFELNETFNPKDFKVIRSQQNLIIEFRNRQGEKKIVELNLD